MANDADKLRNSRIVQQSVNPFGTNFPAGVQSQRNKNLVKHNKGDHFHHNRIVDVLAPYFDNNSPQESLAMVDYLWSKGITVGNNDLNLTGVPEKDHIKSSGIHQYAIVCKPTNTKCTNTKRTGALSSTTQRDKKVRNCPSTMPHFAYLLVDHSLTISVELPVPSVLLSGSSFSTSLRSMARLAAWAVKRTRVWARKR